MAEYIYILRGGYSSTYSGVLYRWEPKTNFMFVESAIPFGVGENPTGTMSSPEGYQAAWDGSSLYVLYWNRPNPPTTDTLGTYLAAYHPDLGTWDLSLASHAHVTNTLDQDVGMCSDGSSVYMLVEGDYFWRYSGGSTFDVMEIPPAEMSIVGTSSCTLAYDFAGHIYAANCGGTSTNYVAKYTINSGIGTWTSAFAGPNTTSPYPTAVKLAWCGTSLYAVVFRNTVNSLSVWKWNGVEGVGSAWTQVGASQSLGATPGVTWTGWDKWATVVSMGHDRIAVFTGYNCPRNFVFNLSTNYWQEHSDSGFTTAPAVGAGGGAFNTPITRTIEWTDQSSSVVSGTQDLGGLYLEQENKFHYKIHALREYSAGLTIWLTFPTGSDISTCTWISTGAIGPWSTLFSTPGLSSGAYVDVYLREYPLTGVHPSTKTFTITASGP